MPTRPVLVSVFALAAALGPLAALPASAQAAKSDPSVVCVFALDWQTTEGEHAATVETSRKSTAGATDAARPGGAGSAAEGDAETEGNEAEAAVPPSPPSPLPEPGPEPGEEKAADECPRAPEEAVVHLEDRLVVRVAGLGAWLSDSKKGRDDLRLFLDGTEVPQLEPLAMQRVKDRPDLRDVRFQLRRTAENRDAWRSLLGPFRQSSRTMTVGVGLAGGEEIASSSDPSITFQAVRSSRLVVYLLLVAVLLTLFFARMPDALRDRHAETPPGTPRPYSLARCQMAWWFFLVLAAYLFLWLVLGDLETITGSVLTLMGIGSGTALGAAVIDSNKEAEKTRAAAKEEAAALIDLAKVPPADVLTLAAAQQTAKDERARLDGAVKKSKGSFLEDILADENGYSLHRFQIFAWSLILGIIFVASVVKDLTMPELSDSLLALMGISGGTYLGFKLPERHA